MFGAIVGDIAGSTYERCNQHMTCVPAETFEWISNLIEDQELREIIEQRKEEKAQEVSLEEL